MKKLLPLLICYVLMQGQCFAISGGPVYGGAGHVNVTGSYSGIIQGVTEVDPSVSGATNIPGDPVSGGETSTTSSNALGLFDLVVPGVTTARGQFLLFADGAVFGGTISASVDPDTARISGILQASYTITASSSTVVDPIFGTSTGSTTTVLGQALGMLSAKVGAANARAATSARLTGTANLDVNFGQIASNAEPIVVRSITFTVSGFQTSASTTTASTLGSAVSTGTSGATSG